MKFKTATQLPKGKDFVAYCPECDGLHVINDGGYIFNAGDGPFVMVVEHKTFKLHKFYLIGEL